ncbi:LOW QUALITY PROTEIN: hypothetical protein NLU13_1871 [Sarocladium strictum]|uniref:Glycosyltransferase family 71 protein n=1 Tax=Sarocladium strictum TaxID=5046 RepID=A0AA39GS12_SARSR|nr:LOW QUALITY PROTEIN: hypothetical protein NLU13_1871 [Sarocladium strictum]
MSIRLPTSRLTSVLLSVCILFFVLLSLSLWTPAQHGSAVLVPEDAPRPDEVSPAVRLKQAQAEAIIKKAKEVAESPIVSPYKDKFGTLGQLTSTWIEFLDDVPASEDKHVLHEAIEGAIATLYPYLLHSPKHPGSTTPFADLRASFEPGSRAFVIPTGKSTMRWAAHLITALQDVLETRLPIIIVYAGELDFPIGDRQILQSHFENIEFMDMINVVDDSTLKLGTGGWAIKAFAALYAPYEQVIVADADCVFVQPPEVLFDDPAYTETGALLFHDRLLRQHSHQDRHDWWKSQIQQPSPALNKSLVWNDDWSEEGDSGVVVLDKSRLDVLTGLLHVAWQNSKAVREEVSYRKTYGDKETWWFGLELSGSKYAFEEHYGGMVGWPHAEQPKNKDEDKICSFYIAHVDARDELLWYKGGLLKFKRGDQKEFGLPTHLMVDGTWHKDGSVEEESCMDHASATELSDETIGILEMIIAAAKEVDIDLGLV